MHTLSLLGAIAAATVLATLAGKAALEVHRAYIQAVNGEIEDFSEFTSIK